MFKKRLVLAKQLTLRPSGHTLNRRQVLSPDRCWAVFDSRNEDAKIGETQTIERVHLQTGLIELLYKTHNATVHGPGVGAAAYHPHDETIIFIHGLRNCDAYRPYGVARRFGALLKTSSPLSIQPAESRRVDGPIRWGELSGGTHAHSWSPSGHRISFTYNDAIQPGLARTVGFIDCTKCPAVEASTATKNFNVARQPEDEDAENFQGCYPAFLVLVPAVSQAIEQAVEECWLDDERLAFLGTINSQKGLIHEVFLADLAIPKTSTLTEDHANKSLAPSSLQPAPSSVCRLTFLEDRKHPGVQGPRHWLTPLPDGSAILFLLKDCNGIDQLAIVSTKDSQVRMLTNLKHSIEGQMAVSRTGRYASFVSGGLIHVMDLETENIEQWVESRWETYRGLKISQPKYVGSYVGAAHFADEETVIVNRYVEQSEGRFLQIFLLTS